MPDPVYGPDGKLINPDTGITPFGQMVADGSVPFNSMIPGGYPVIDLGITRGAEVLPAFINSPYSTLPVRGSRVTFTIGLAADAASLIITAVTLTAFADGRGDAPAGTGSPLPAVTGADADLVSGGTFNDGDNLLFKAAGFAVQPQRPYAYNDATGRIQRPQWLQHYSNAILDALLVEAYLESRWGSGTCNQFGETLSCYPFWGGPARDETTMNGAANGGSNIMLNAAWIYAGGPLTSDRLKVDVKLDTDLEFPNDPAVPTQFDETLTLHVSFKIFMAGYTICRNVAQNGCVDPTVLLLQRQLASQNQMIQQLARQLPNGVK